MAKVTERKGKKSISYQVRYRIGQDQNTKTFPTKKEADKFAKEIEAQKTLGLAKSESSTIFREYAKIFFEVYTDGLSESTVDSYNQCMIQVDPYIGKSKLKKITPHDIDQMFIKLKAKGLMNSTLKLTLTVLNFVLNAAFQDDLISFNPTLKMKFKFRDEINEDDIISGNQLTDKKFLSDDQLRKAIEVSENDGKFTYVFIIKVGYGAGMRIGEIIGWKWSDIDFEKRTYIVCRQITSKKKIKPTKNKKTRVGYLNDYLLEVLTEIKSYQDMMKRLYGSSYTDNDLVVCKENGSPLIHNTITNKFSTYYDGKLDFHFTPHMLRHTYATKLQHVNKHELMETLGHQNEQTTKIYTHFNDFSVETRNTMDAVLKLD